MSADQDKWGQRTLDKHFPESPKDTIRIDDTINGDKDPRSEAEIIEAALQAQQRCIVVDEGYDCLFDK